MPDPTSAPIRVAIVDDEPLARDCVRLALEPDPDFLVVAQCGDGRAAVDAIHRHRPDLVFLDVQMPGVDGFDVIEAVGPERMPAIVFVTAFDAYAVRAFDAHALDYLLKPFDDQRFAETRRRARELLRASRAGETERRLAALLAGRSYASRLLVRNDDRLEFLPVAEVDWFEAAGNYVRAHAGQRSEQIRITLAGLLERLDPNVFARIHRSVIVNLGRVRAMHPWYGGDYTAVLADGRELRVSRFYRAALLRTVG
jgi:two-component system, LytTR family, response regulator